MTNTRADTGCLKKLNEEVVMKTNMKGWVMGFLLLVVLVWGALNGASAAIINVEGLKYGGDVSAVVDFEYIPINERNGEIRLLIENTSNMDFSVKAFFVNLPDEIRKARLYGNPGWKSLFHSDPCFHAGLFHFVGFSKFGPIKQGESSEFAIVVKGKDLSGLSEASFVDLLMDDGLTFFFKGKDSSNKYRFDAAVPVSAGIPTPIPSAIFLLGPALAMIGGLRLAGRKMKTR
jgi:hypothetical protein